MKPVAGATLFRLTLNTMKDPDVVGATIALGDSPAALPIPDGANASVPAQFFLVWHGNTAVLKDAATGLPVGSAPGVRVDTERRQVELRVDHSAWNPGTGNGQDGRGRGRLGQGGEHLRAGRPDRDGDDPGRRRSRRARRSSTSRSAAAEPNPDIANTATLLGDPTWWRDRRQGSALRTGDLSSFRADVDFGKLAAGTNDESGVPTKGSINRIYASRFETKQGVDFALGVRHRRRSARASCAGSSSRTRCTCRRSAARTATA